MSDAPQSGQLPETAPGIDHEFVIVGSGFSGLGAAVALQQKGLRDFVIFEKSDQLGGTWVAHDYPGLEVDMPFFIYSYPFETKSDWKHVYPSGREMKDYPRHLPQRNPALASSSVHTANVSASDSPPLSARNYVSTIYRVSSFS